MEINVGGKLPKRMIFYHKRPINSAKFFNIFLCKIIIIEFLLIMDMILIFLVIFKHNIQVLINIVIICMLLIHIIISSYIVM